MVRFSEEDKETIWTMREAGVPVKRIAKHWIDRTPRFAGSSLTMEEKGRRLVSDPSSGCLWPSGKRSPEVWPPDFRFGPSPPD